MADVAPLRPLRYAARHAADLAPLVAPPYDVVTPAARAALVAQSPHNVIELELPAGEGDAKYAHAAELLARWRAEGVLVRDDEPAFYAYAQTFVPPGGGARRTRRGFLGLARAVPFADRVVLPHERTLSGPKADRLALFRATGASMSPGFLLYRDPARALDAALASGTPVARFTTADGIDHELTRVAAPDAIAAIERHLAGCQLLVADGHHRYETSVAYAAEVDARLDREGAATARDPEHRYYLAFFCNEDDPDLVVAPTHRLVRAVAGFDAGAFLARARRLFDVREASGEGTAVLDEIAAIGRDVPALALALGAARALVLTLRPDADLAAHPTLGQLPEALRRTSVALLHAGLLEDALGISREAQAAKTNLDYEQDAARVLARVQAGEAQLGALLVATPVSVVRAVAEAGEVMPQKSTFFYPKVPTGLVIHTLDPQRSVRPALAAR